MRDLSIKEFRKACESFPPMTYRVVSTCEEDDGHSNIKLILIFSEVMVTVWPNRICFVRSIENRENPWLKKEYVCFENVMYIRYRDDKCRKDERGKDELVFEIVCSADGTNENCESYYVAANEV